MNSILMACATQSASLEAEIVQKIRGHSVDGKRLILVEGDSDRIVYQKFYDEELFEVYGSERFSGCVHFETMLRHINEYYENRLIVIKDADFDHLNHKTYDDCPNLFLTDTHDLETLMMRERSYERMNHSLSIDNAKEFMTQAVYDILNLSYLKWMNNRYSSKLNFKKKCKVGSCYEGKAEVPVGDWLRKITSCTQNLGKRIFNEDEVEQFKSVQPIDNSNILQITNGHDMITAFVIKFKHEYRKNLLKKDVEELICDSFSIEDYAKTQLYKEVQNWLMKENIN